MDLPKPNYLALKRILETAKYKNEYLKSKEKYLTPNNRLRVSSLRHSRKNSGTNFKTADLYNAVENSIVVHKNELSLVSDSINTCLNTVQFSNLKNKVTQTEEADERENENEFKMLKSEIEALKREVLEIRNEIIRQGIEEKGEDKENRESLGFVKLMRKLESIRKMNS